jgi:hypothetical protein
VIKFIISALIFSTNLISSQLFAAESNDMYQDDNSIEQKSEISFGGCIAISDKGVMRSDIILFKGGSIDNLTHRWTQFLKSHGDNARSAQCWLPIKPGKSIAYSELDRRARELKNSSGSNRIISTMWGG